ncbi:lyase family protein [Paenibacillus sp. MMO-58]|uniref:lyase family protein n=1 Tax=Paenibacillus sp. MMO-58 TaxID=3081290 RepID=UPI0030194CF3
MLEEQGLVAEEDAAIIAEMLQNLDLKKLENGHYTGEFEDLFFEVEHELEHLGGETTGHLHLARSRNDMGIAIYRIVLRAKLLTLIASGLELQERLIDFAEEHAETLMIGYTHTQQAQPTTVGHYIAAVSDSLSRDVRRLRAALIKQFEEQNPGITGLISAFGIFLMRQFMESLPSELLDAARIDGLNEWRVFSSIALPLMKPALATLAILSFISSWNLRHGTSDGKGRKRDSTYERRKLSCRTSDPKRGCLVQDASVVPVPSDSFRT